MAVAVYIYPALNLLHSRYWGAVTGEDLRGNMKTIREHPDFRVGLNRLVDLTDVTEFDYSASEAVSLSEEVSKHYVEDEEPILCAYLAPTPLAFGMARMFATLLSDSPALEVGVFRAADKALDFLGVSEPLPSQSEDPPGRGES